MTTYLFTDLEWGNPAGWPSILLTYDETFAISQEVRSEGLILIYVRFGEDVVWIPAPIPYVEPLGAADPYAILVDASPVDLGLFLRRPDGTPIPLSEPVVNLSAVRVIAVPPGTVILANSAGNDLTALSYDEVTALLGIRE